MITKKIRVAVGDGSRKVQALGLLRLWRQPYQNDAHVTDSTVFNGAEKRPKAIQNSSTKQ